jgi:hypothetical protein
MYLIYAEERPKMETPGQMKKQACVCVLLAATLTILGEGTAAADTIQLVFDVQLNTLSNDVTGEISSVQPFSVKDLTFLLNDTVTGNVVAGGGLQKRTLFQPPRVPLFSPTPFTSNLLATNPGSSSVPISETYLKQQFNPTVNRGGTFFALGDFKSFTGPIQRTRQLKISGFTTHIFIAVDSPPDPTIQGPGDLMFLTSQDLHDFLNTALQNGYEVEFVETTGLFQDGNLTRGLTYFGPGVLKSARVVPEPATFALLGTVLAGLIAISLPRKIKFRTAYRKTRSLRKHDASCEH